MNWKACGLIVCIVCFCTDRVGYLFAFTLWFALPLGGFGLNAVVGLLTANYFVLFS